jgi:hypothetical protein
MPAALMRGRVMRFLLAPYYICDIMIVEDGRLSLVRIRLAGKLRAGIAELGIGFSDSIVELGKVPCGGPVSRELWLYNRHGSLRFFRITDTGLVEIDRYGMLFVDGKPVAANPAPAVDGNSSQFSPAETGQIRSAEDEPHLAIIRWMAKREAKEDPAGGKISALSSMDPGKDSSSLAGNSILPAADGSSEGPGSPDRSGAEDDSSLPMMPSLSPVPAEKGKAV